MASIHRIFEFALKHALRSGYEPVPGRKVVAASVVLQINTASYVHLTVESEKGKRQMITVGLNDILFDPGFLRGLYGDQNHDWPGRVNHEKCRYCDVWKDTDWHVPHCFQFHAQQLAILGTVKGRINYIGSTKPTGARA